MWKKQKISNPKRLNIELNGDKQVFMGNLISTRPSLTASAIFTAFAGIIGFNAYANPPNIPTSIGKPIGIDGCQEALDTTNYSSSAIDATNTSLGHTLKQIDDTEKCSGTFFSSTAIRGRDIIKIKNEKICTDAKKQAEIKEEERLRSAIQICQKTIVDQYPILNPIVQRIIENNIDDPEKTYSLCRSLEKNALKEANKLMQPKQTSPRVKEKTDKGTIHIGAILERQEYIKKHTAHSSIALYQTNNKYGRFTLPPELIDEAKVYGNIEIIAVTDHSYDPKEGKLIISGSAGSTRGNLNKKTFDGVGTRRIGSVIPPKLSKKPIQEDKKVVIDQLNVTLDRKNMWYAGNQLKIKAESEGRELIGVRANYTKDGRLVLDTNPKDARYIEAIAVIVNHPKNQEKLDETKNLWKTPIKTFYQSILDDNSIQIDHNYLTQMATLNRTIESYPTRNEAPIIVRAGTTRITQTLEQELDWAIKGETYQDSILNPNRSVNLDWQYTQSLKQRNLEATVTDESILTDVLLDYREQQLPPLETTAINLYNHTKERIKSKSKSFFNKLACFFSNTYRVKMELV
ncbi:MAG TPA: hypothetical protein VJB89_01865 [Candidatus Nanoarchaeia archaeon]|nr:hypothetical protein [Candidatus Nanoarchaeia archaeon]